MELSSQQLNSWISATTKASRLTSLPWHILKAMDRWSMQTVFSYKVSSHGFSTDSGPMLRAGSRSYRRCYGPYKQRRVTPQASHHSPWSTGQRSCCPQKSTIRVQHYNKNQSNKSQVNNLDQLKELQEAAVILSAKYQQALRKYHAQSMFPRGFSVGEFIL